MWLASDGRADITQTMKTVQSPLPFDVFARWYSCRDYNLVPASSSCMVWTKVCRHWRGGLWQVLVFSSLADCGLYKGELLTTMAAKLGSTHEGASVCTAWIMRDLGIPRLAVEAPRLAISSTGSITTDHTGMVKRHVHNLRGPYWNDWSLASLSQGKYKLSVVTKRNAIVVEILLKYRLLCHKSALERGHFILWYNMWLAPIDWHRSSG